MSRVAVVGASPRVDGWALAGALVVPVADSHAARAAWDALPYDVDVVVVTPAIAHDLHDRIRERLVVVLP
jgi:vacuolar-type H+-ATPase subunit F/Vma7